MPFINVKTNVSVSEEKEKELKAALGKAITAIPGKSESWLMVGIEPDSKLWFKGDDSPCAMVDVSIFGTASSGDYEKLTGKVSSIINDIIGVSPARIYLKYSEISEWGWNGSNF